MAKRWEHFHHGADIGIRGIGKTLAEAFAAAAEAVAAVCVDPAKIRCEKEIKIEISEKSIEILLFSMIDELIFRLRDFAFCRFDAKIIEKDEKFQLILTGYGEDLDPARHQPAVEIKGPTMTELCVRNEGGRWIAQCVVDV